MAPNYTCVMTPVLFSRFRILGRLRDAKDAVQEAWLRLSRSGTSDVENPRGWLTTVVAGPSLGVGAAPVWTHRGDYVLARPRIRRWLANEALADPERLVIASDPASSSGRGVRTIGWSDSAMGILTTITLIDNGRLYDVNG